MADFKKVVNSAFDSEGGFQNYSNDTANYCGSKLIGTNRGISAIAYKEFYGACPTVEQMKALTKQQAETIYKKLFWDKISGDKIKNQSVAEVIFEAFIASGYTGLARVRDVVATYGLRVTSGDGFNSAEIDMINSISDKIFWQKLVDSEKANRIALAEANPSKYAMFLNGWLNRISRYKYSESAPSFTVILLLLVLLIFLK